MKDSEASLKIGMSEGLKAGVNEERPGKRPRTDENTDGPPPEPEDGSDRPGAGSPLDTAQFYYYKDAEAALQGPFVPADMCVRAVTRARAP